MQQSDSDDGGCGEEEGADEGEADKVSTCHGEWGFL